MAEQAQAAPAAPPAGADRLHEVARLLREARYLGPQARSALAEFVDELAGHVGCAPTAAAAGRLVEVLRREEEGPLAEARDRLEEAVLAAEGRAPVITGLARQLLDALAKLGI